MLERLAFALTCLLAALFMGGSWGALIYQLDHTAGWVIGLTFGFMTFFLLLSAGWNPDVRLAAKRNRRFDD